MHTKKLVLSAPFVGAPGVARAMSVFSDQITTINSRMAVEFMDETARLLGFDNKVVTWVNPVMTDPSSILANFAGLALSRADLTEAITLAGGDQATGHTVEVDTLVRITTVRNIRQNAERTGIDFDDPVAKDLLADDDFLLLAQGAEAFEIFGLSARPRYVFDGRSVAEYFLTDMQTGGSIFDHDADAGRATDHGGSTRSPNISPS